MATDSISHANQDSSLPARQRAAEVAAKPVLHKQCQHCQIPIRCPASSHMPSDFSLLLSRMQSAHVMVANSATVAVVRFSHVHTRDRSAFSETPQALEAIDRELTTALRPDRASAIPSACFCPSFTFVTCTIVRLQCISACELVVWVTSDTARKRL